MIEYRGNETSTQILETIFTVPGYAHIGRKIFYELSGKDLSAARATKRSWNVFIEKMLQNETDRNVFTRKLILQWSKADVVEKELARHIGGHRCGRITDISSKGGHLFIMRADVTTTHIEIRNKQTKDLQKTLHLNYSGVKLHIHKHFLLACTKGRFGRQDLLCWLRSDWSLVNLPQCILNSETGSIEDIQVGQNEMKIIYSDGKLQQKHSIEFNNDKNELSFKLIEKISSTQSTPTLFKSNEILCFANSFVNHNNDQFPCYPITQSNTNSTHFNKGIKWVYDTIHIDEQRVYTVLKRFTNSISGIYIDTVNEANASSRGDTSYIQLWNMVSTECVATFRVKAVVEVKLTELFIAVCEYFGTITIWSINDLTSSKARDMVVVNPIRVIKTGTCVYKFYMDKTMIAWVYLSQAIRYLDFWYT